MNLAAVLLVMTKAAVDPCAPVTPADVPDPAEAAAYLHVGEAERAAGSPETAALAFREALRLDPSAAAARAALQALCHPPPDADALLFHGIELMKQGHLRRAIEAFHKSRQLEDTPAAALLEGMSLYELGRDAEAQPLLERARASPPLADSAAFYLGLLELREGESARASALLRTASSSEDARLRGAASRLLQVARRQGKLMLSLYVAGGYDSNVDLGPEGIATPGQDGDGAASATLSVAAHPFGPSGPYLGGSGTFRKQVHLTDFDFGAAQGRAGWQFERPSLLLDGEYAFDALSLGGAPYLLSHRFLARAQGIIGRFTLGATYFLRLESYQPAELVDFSGVHQVASADFDVRLGWRTHLGLSYLAERDGARVAELSYWQHGPALALSFQPAEAWTLELGGDALFRGYDVVDPDLGIQRSDEYLDADAGVFWQLAGGFSVQLLATARKAFSNVAEFAYARFTADLGLGWTAGFF